MSDEKKEQVFQSQDWKSRYRKKSVAERSLNFQGVNIGRQCKEKLIERKKAKTFQNVSKRTDVISQIKDLLVELETNKISSTQLSELAEPVETHRDRVTSLSGSTKEKITVLAKNREWESCLYILNRQKLDKQALDKLLILVCSDAVVEESLYANDLFLRRSAIKVIEKLIDLEANPNVCDSLGRSMLWLVCEENELDFLKALTRHGKEDKTAKANLIPDPDFYVKLQLENDPTEKPTTKLWSCWHVAIDKCNADMISVLMNCEIKKLVHELDTGETKEQYMELWEREGSPLIICVDESKNQRSCLKCLTVLVQELALSQDADVFATFFDINATNHLGQTALHVACKKGYDEVVDVILEYVHHSPITKPQKADLNMQDHVANLTPLMYAISFVFVSICKKLFEKSKALSVTRQHLKHDLSLRCLVDEQTCLHLACSNPVELDDVTLLLCKNKVAVNAVDAFGYNSLLLACVQGHVRTVKVLLDYNANLLVKSKTAKESALHIAAASGFISIVNLLISKGAIIHCEDHSGRTPLHHAFEKLSFLLRIKNLSKKKSKTAVPDAIDILQDSPCTFGFLHHPSYLSDQETLRKHMLDRRVLDLEIAGQNMVIKQLLDEGANLEHEDDMGETAFITTARELYFKNNRKNLMEIVNHPQELGYTNEMFIDKRTQASVNTMYIKSGSKLIAIKNLLIWLFYTALVTYIALDYNGSNYFDSFSLEELIKEKFAFEEFDNLAEVKTLFDVMNVDDWKEYLINVFSKSLDDSNDTSSEFPHLTPGLTQTTQLLGAIRMRIIFSEQEECRLNAHLGSLECSENVKNEPLHCPGLSFFTQFIDEIPFTQQDILNSKSFMKVIENDELLIYVKGLDQSIYVKDEANNVWHLYKSTINSTGRILDLKDFLLPQQSADLNGYHIWGNYGRISGSQLNGYMIILPFSSSEFINLVEALHACSYIDPNVRGVVLDVNVFNAALQLFSHVNVFVEQTVSGHVRGNIRLHTSHIFSYLSSTTSILSNENFRLLFEILFLFMSLNYMSSEISSLLNDTWDEKYLEECCAPRYWFFVVLSEKRAIHHAVEDPHSFKILITSPLPAFRKCLCLYRTKKVICPYLNNLFNYIDLLIILLIVVLVVTQCVAIVLQNGLLSKISTLSRENILNETYLNVIPLLKATIFRQYVIGFLTFLCYIKILEFIQISNMFAIPVIVIGGMITQLMSFFTIFLIFLLAFASLKHILYGLQLQAFSTLFKSLIATFTSSLGDVQFAELSGTDFSFGYVLSIVVTFILVILLLNLLIAIMNEAYDEVKSTAEARWCYMQFRMIVNNEENRRSKFSIFSHIVTLFTKCFQDISQDKFTLQAEDRNNNHVNKHVALCEGSGDLDFSTFKQEFGSLSTGEQASDARKKIKNTNLMNRLSVLPLAAFNKRNEKASNRVHPS